MRYYWDLIRHFFISNSRHGTHSPFVYGLACHVIYHVSRVQPHTVAVPVDFNLKYKNLLLDILTYIDIQELAYWGQSDHAAALFVDSPNIPSEEITEVVRAGKMVVIHEPFQTRETKRTWQKFVQSTDIVVSINLFHFGLLIYREGQRKEDFVLRYPFWRK